MAVRKFILVAGQSNATEVAPSQDWEDLNSYLSLRSPQNASNTVPQFGSGTYDDVIQMPYTFDGGPQTGVNGDGTSAGSWQRANVLGKASQAIRYLTFYDPCASQLALRSSHGIASTYPGTAKILAGSTPTTLKTSVRWTDDPVNIKITRQRTGEDHTIQSGWSASTNEITISPPMVPAPEVGEQFTYEVQIASASTAGKLVFCNQFGGSNFTTAFEGGLTGADSNGGISLDSTVQAGHGSYISQIRQANGTALSARVVCPNRLLKVGDAVRFTANGAIGVSAIEDISVGTDYYVVRKGDFNETVNAPSSAWDATNNAIQLAHGLGHHETVTLTGQPSGLEAGTAYVVETELTLTGSWATGGGASSNSTITLTDHDLVDGNRVVFSYGSFMPPSGPTVGETAYYVKKLTDDTFQLYENANLTDDLVTWDDHSDGTSTMVLCDSFRLTTDYSGTRATFSAATSNVTITRIDSHATVYISENVGGEEITANGSSGSAASADRLRLSIQPTFRGSLAGMQARCVSGTAANVGLTRNLGDVYYDSSTDNAVVRCDDWPQLPQPGDKFVIEVQNQAAEFHKWAMWLPWCPFEGSAGYASLWNVYNPYFPSTAPTDTLEILLVQNQPISSWSSVYPQVNQKWRFYSKTVPLGGLTAGRDYYIHSAALSVGGYKVTLKENYDDTEAIEGSIPSSTLTLNDTAYCVDEEGKSNPFPPGFNYPNHHATPRPYQAYDGSSVTVRIPTIGFHTGLAYRLHEHYGEVMNTAVCAMTGTSIGHREVWNAATIDIQHAWWDYKQQKSWSPGEPNNCFARLEDTLDAAKTAFEAEGDTGECVGIFWAQGEADASELRQANNYENSARKIKAALRNAVKSRGLTTLDEDKIPFIHPKIYEASGAWTYASTVNASIQALADEDPYSRTFSVEDLTLTDDFHYDGASMNTLGDRCYEAWKDIQRSGSSEVDICNLALTNIGDKATVTSINPSDGSHQADLCARYYPLARDLLLERHRWDFTIRHVSPVALTASGRTDWQYAFKLPSNFTGVISVLPKDSTDDQITQGTATPQPFAIESNSDLDRVLYTNVPDVILRYQAKITDSTKFSQMFVHAVSWQLSSMLAGALIKGDDGAAAVQNATRMAEFYTEKAAAYDSRSTREKPVVDGNTNPWDR